MTVDGSNRIKPDITAPGTNTRSASNTPIMHIRCQRHVHGDSAHRRRDGLLWSAHSKLAAPDDCESRALNNAAVHIASTQCGTAGPPNNVYGWGRVDIAAAVGHAITTATPSPTPTQRLQLRRAATEKPTPTPTDRATATGHSNGNTRHPHAMTTPTPRPSLRRDLPDSEASSHTPPRL